MSRHTIPATLDQLEGMGDAIRQLFESHQLAGSHEDSLGMVQLAVHELLVNIMEHAYPTEKGDIVIEMGIADEMFSAELTDTGISFDPSTVAEPDPHALQENGFGLFLIDTIMDLVEYRPGVDGNVWKVSKKL